MYNLAEKFPKVGKGANPYIDPAGYFEELDARERVVQSKARGTEESVGKE
jgi:hypothetical protein